MNNMLITTIRFSVIAGIALFAFTGDVFAAATLSPVSVVRGDTVVTLTTKAINPVWRNTTVWYEWGDNSSALSAVGMTTIFNEGFFEARVTDLKPGATYYFRAAAMDGQTTVYSPLQQVTLAGGVIVPVTITPTVSAVASTATNNTKPVVTTSAKATTPVVEKKTIATPTPIKGTNANSAAVIGAGDGIFPTTLVGWIALFVAILLAVLLMHMILETNENRRKALEELRGKAKRFHDEPEVPLTA